MTSHFNFSKSKTARSPLRKARQEHIVAWNPGSESCVDLSSKRCGVGSMQTAMAHTSLTIKSAPEIAGETPSTPQDQHKKMSLLNSTSSGLILHWIYSISSLNILIYDYNCKLELRAWIRAPFTHTHSQTDVPGQTGTALFLYATPPFCTVQWEGNKRDCIEFNSTHNHREDKCTVTNISEILEWTKRKTITWLTEQITSIYILFIFHTHITHTHTRVCVYMCDFFFIKLNISYTKTNKNDKSPLQNVKK